LKRFSQVHTQYRPLRLNVGFLLSQTAGYGRQFDFLEDKIIMGGDLQVEAFTGSLQLMRTPQGIVAKGDFSTRLAAECARCLQPFAAPVSIHLEDLFVYPPQNATDPLLSIGEDAHLNLEPLMREYILINKPTRPLCTPECKGLCTVCGNNLNENACDHPDEEPAGLAPVRLVLKEDSKNKKPAAPKAVKLKTVRAAPAPVRKTNPVKKKTPGKKNGAKAPRPTTTGGMKKAAGKKKTTGAKKKNSTKK
jgi:uncharacterized protein